MNEQSMVHRGLLGKELRQLSSLAIAVVLFAALFGIIAAIFNTINFNASGPTAWIFLIAPAVFSVGAGAMSVGQDKESRTLDWLKTLPVTPRTLACTKLAAALFYLAGLWVLIYIGGFAISLFDPSFMMSSIVQEHPLTSAWAWHRIGFSVYLLICGFLTAWYFSTAMVSLIAIVPLAILPPTVSLGVAYAIHPGLPFNNSKYDPTLVSALVPVFLLTIFATWMLLRFAQRNLGPAELKADRSLYQRLNPYAQADQLISDDSKVVCGRVVDPYSAMLWQFWRQNQTVYFGLIAMAIVGAVLYYREAFLPSLSTSRVVFSGDAIGVVLIWLATTWMGVSVFLGDSIRDRIRFFADRGVGPTGIWLTRMWIPLSFIFAASLVYAAMLWRNADSIGQHVSLLMFFTGLMLAFGWSQWLSQFGGGPILNFIVAPPLAFLATLYCGYATIELLMPLWFLAVCVISPFVTTWLMTGRWMSRRSGRGQIVPHLSIAALIVLLPVSNFFLSIGSTPAMPRAIRAELQSAMTVANFVSPQLQSNLRTARNPDLYYSPDQLVSQRFNMDPEEKTEAAAQFFDSKAVLVDFRQRFKGLTVTDGTTHQYAVDAILMNELSGRMLLAILAMEQTSELESVGNHDDATADQAVSTHEGVQRYRDTFELLFEITGSLRRSEVLASQENADWGEIFLIRELQHPLADERIGNPLRAKALRLVGDINGRNEARKRAIRNLWYRNEASPNNTPATETLPRFNYRYQSNLYNWMTLRRRFDHLIFVLLTALDAGPQLSKESKEVFLRDRFLCLGSDLNSVHRFDHSMRPSLGVENPLDHRTGVIQDFLPGAQWFAGWESIGIALDNQVKNSEGAR